MFKDTLKQQDVIHTPLARIHMNITQARQVAGQWLCHSGFHYNPKKANMIVPGEKGGRPRRTSVFIDIELN